MSAVRYHVNPETGRPNLCKAKIRCDFAVDGQEPPHFPNKAEAREYVEQELTKEHGATTSLTKVHSSNDSTTVSITPKAKNPWAERRESDKAENERIEEAIRKDEEKQSAELEAYYQEQEAAKSKGVYEYTITEGNYDKAINAIEAVNRKLEKAGIDERFEYEMEEKNAVKTDDLGRKIAYTYYKLKMNRPVISHTHNGVKHRFLAAVSRADAGYVVRTASGADLQGWRPDNLVCDHCGQKRMRNKTYIIEGPDGKRMQIGSACVDVFLGAKPEGLWAMSHDPLDTLDDGIESVYNQPPKPETTDVMAMALAVTQGGTMYVSKSRAEDTGIDSTAYRFSKAMFMSRKDITDPQDQEYFDNLDNEALRYKLEGKAEETLEKLKVIEGSGDYFENLRTLAKGNFIKERDTALLISGIAALNRIEREKEREEERQKAKEKKIAEFTPGHYGKVDDKLEKGTVLKLHSKRTYADEDYWGNPITKTVITAKDDDGHMVSWFTGVEINAEPGDDLVISSGKVKKHSNYQGVDQTMLGNVRLMKKKD